MLLPLDKLELGEPSVGGALAAVGHQGAVIVHLAVDQTVVGGWSSGTGCHDALDDAEIFFVIPVAQQDGANVAIIVDVLGSVDDHGPEQASSILTGVMRVIPRRAVNVRFELIGERLLGRNRALLDRGHPVEPRSGSLEDPMPMQGRPLFWFGNLVVHFHLNGVSPIRFDQWARELTVDQDDALVDPIRGDEATLDGEVVGSDDPGGRRLFIRVAVVRRPGSPRIALRQRVVRQEIIDERCL